MIAAAIDALFFYSEALIKEAKGIYTLQTIKKRMGGFTSGIKKNTKGW